MNRRKIVLLKWVGLVELIVGAWNLVLTVMSWFALTQESPQEILRAIEKETGAALTLSQLYGPLVMTALGGLFMALAGALALKFTFVKGKEKLLVGAGCLLLVYVMAADVIHITFMGGALAASAVFPFILHGLYLWGAFKNKAEV